MLDWEKREEREMEKGRGEGGDAGREGRRWWCLLCRKYEKGESWKKKGDIAGQVWMERKEGCLLCGTGIKGKGESGEKGGSVCKVGKKKVKRDRERVEEREIVFVR